MRRKRDPMDLISAYIHNMSGEDFAKASEEMYRRPRLHSAIVQHFAGLVTKLPPELRDAADQIIMSARHGNYDQALGMCQKLRIAPAEQINNEHFDTSVFKQKVENNQQKKQEKREAVQEGVLTQNQRQQAENIPADLGPAPGQGQYPNAMALSLVNEFKNAIGWPNKNQIIAFQSLFGMNKSRYIMKSTSQRNAELEKAFRLDARRTMRKW